MLPRDDLNQTSCGFCCCSLANRLLVVTFMILLSVAILFGNSVSLAVFLSAKQFRTSQGYLRISLAVADMALGVLVVPFSVYAELSLLSGNSSFRDWSREPSSGSSSGSLCAVVGPVFAGCTLVSISTVFLLAMERSVAILKPLHKEAVLTRRRTLLLILLSWLSSFFLALCPLLFGRGGIVVEYDRCSRLCNYAPAPASPASAWNLLLLFPAFDFSLLGATLVINALSFTAIRQYSRRRKQLAGNEQGLLRLPCSDLKAAKTIGILTLAFTASFAPIAVFLVGNVLGYQWCTFSFFAFWILTSNSCWNAIIYSVQDQRFREGARRLLLPGQCHGLHSQH